MMDANDIKATQLLQGVWVRCGRRSAEVKILHAIRYLRNRDVYASDKKRMQDLLTIRRHNAARAVAEARVINL